MTEEEPLEDFDWAQFHRLAGSLLEIGDEAAQRSAISRDYYAIFNCAKTILGLLDPDFSGPRGLDSHQAVWDGVRALKRKQATNLARIGQSLLGKRKLADYRNHVSGSWDHRARQAHEEAERGLRQLTELLRQSRP